MEMNMNFRCEGGLVDQLGAQVLPDGISFTVQSLGASACRLLLFHIGEPSPFAILPFPPSCRFGQVFSMKVCGLTPERLEYAYQLDGTTTARLAFQFDGQQTILDPYADAVGQYTTKSGDWIGPYRGQFVDHRFDWEGVTSPKRALSDLIIYELHVRGFTKDPSSGVTAPGTFQGLIEKIPYLKSLGINAIELMPIFDFDETNDLRYHDGQRLTDYWGYNPIHYFSPKSTYAQQQDASSVAREFKSLVKACHQAGIEVILDVVYNHTPENGANHRWVSFRGLDPQTYYLYDAAGEHLNYSGCGNTVNANHPVVIDLICHSIRHWVKHYHIDGFRFDLASILTRGQDGQPMDCPPLIDRLSKDPLLQGVKLIAEAWDAGGLYQVGRFPNGRYWAEWNGRYRDDLRQFLKGDPGKVSEICQRVAGSPDLYDALERPSASINFITCHDGFTLNDLYAYKEKHNLANGWQNLDGEVHNNSWNCGAEGPTADPQIENLRCRLAANAFAVLLFSRGVPMFFSGDECRRTQQGNNNAYCQDNPLSWLQWDQMDQAADLVTLVSRMIQFRKDFPVVRRCMQDLIEGYADIPFHGHQPGVLDAYHEDRYLGVLFAGMVSGEPQWVMVCMNMYWDKIEVQLPALPENYHWVCLVNTGDPATPYGRAAASLAEAPDVATQIPMEGRSVQILTGRPINGMPSLSD